MPWKEATTDDGKKYYHHSDTGETTWTKPADFGGGGGGGIADWCVRTFALSPAARREGGSHPPRISRTPHALVFPTLCAGRSRRQTTGARTITTK